MMKIALISKEYTTSKVIFGCTLRALKFYWEAEHFVPGQEPEGWDSYLFIDNCDFDYYHCPRYAHPSVFWAMDMTVPRWQHGPDLSQCVARARTFDRVFASTHNATNYFIEHGINARWLPFCADEDVHKPIKGKKEYEATAVWHNCGERIEYSKALRKHFDAWVGYSEDDGYCEWMSKGRCTLNLTRADEPNMRIFEAMMMGIPLVTDVPRTMDVLFTRDEHYRGFANVEEMVHQVTWIMEHLGAAGQMAVKARRKVLDNHTYKHRVREIYGSYRWLSKLL